ncbi:MAG TPA: glycoside hydrolase domain-containing protein, partial [Terracidiphilus sp.]|nr:glycoside hydrolase domain-containing protein [Terracidiphilus sp.]
GFYPICPGKAEYVAGSPLFDRATLRLPGGKTAVIEAQNQAPEAVYVGRLLVNGKPRTEPVISHEEIAGGGRLTFAMQTEPATRA